MDTLKLVLALAGCLTAMVGAFVFIAKMLAKSNEKLTVELVKQVVTENRRGIDSVVTETRRGNDRLIEQGKELTSALKEQSTAITKNTAETARCSQALSTLALHLSTPPDVLDDAAEVDTALVARSRTSHRRK